jgi:hypothetical protein
VRALEALECAVAPLARVVRRAAGGATTAGEKRDVVGALAHSEPVTFASEAKGEARLSVRDGPMPAMRSRLEGSSFLRGADLLHGRRSIDVDAVEPTDP